MELVLFVLFFLLIIIFCCMFFSKYWKRTSIPQLSRHRHPQNLRRKRSDPIEITTTGDIYGLLKRMPIVIDNSIPDGTISFVDSANGKELGKIINIE